MTRLGHLRNAVDVVDDLMVAALAARHRLVARIAHAKAGALIAADDPAREAVVHRRALRLADHLGLPRTSASALLGVAIADARTLQGLPLDVGHGPAGPSGNMIDDSMEAEPRHVRRWLRLVPPPARWKPFVRRVPAPLQRRLLEQAVASVLAGPVARGALDFMQGRRLGVEVSDLGLQWTLELRGSRLVVVDDAPEARVRASATDLLLLAARLEDADSLFFQRRLEVTGDTELGLTARNALDRLPWDAVPLAVRIPLHRAALLARAARDAHHAVRADT